MFLQWWETSFGAGRLSLLPSACPGWRPNDVFFLVKKLTVRFGQKLTRSQAAMHPVTFHGRATAAHFKTSLFGFCSYCRPCPCRILLRLSFGTDISHQFTRKTVQCCPVVVVVLFANQNIHTRPMCAHVLGPCVCVCAWVWILKPVSNMLWLMHFQIIFTLNSWNWTCKTTLPDFMRIDWRTESLKTIGLMTEHKSSNDWPEKTTRVYLNVTCGTGDPVMNRGMNRHQISRHAPNNLPNCSFGSFRQKYNISWKKLLGKTCEAHKLPSAALITHFF